MSHSSFTILAALYQLLATTNEVDLRAASMREDIGPNLRTALAALAAEAASRAGPDQSVPSIAKRQRARPRVPRDRMDPRRTQLVQAIRFISDRRNFSDKAALARFAAEVGLDVKIDSKMGMPRAARVIANALAANPHVLAKLDAMREQSSFDPTTKGWLDIILRSK